MELPQWIKDQIAEFEAPKTGRISFSFELYNGNITKLELATVIRKQPEPKPKQN